MSICERTTQKPMEIWLTIWTNVADIPKTTIGLLPLIICNNLRWRSILWLHYRSLRRCNVDNVDLLLLCYYETQKRNKYGWEYSQPSKLGWWIIYKRYVLQTAQLINLSVLKISCKQTICRKQKCKLYHMSLILTIQLTFIKIARSFLGNLQTDTICYSLQRVEKSIE